MIIECINGIGCDLSYRFEQDTVDLIGIERIALIDEMLLSSAIAQVNSSFCAALSGALRWNPALRPEVLIDATGRLL